MAAVVHSYDRNQPEWGKVWNFGRNNHLKQELSLEDVERFILETYRAEIGNIGMAILGFACILVNPLIMLRWQLFVRLKTRLEKRGP